MQKINFTDGGGEPLSAANLNLLQSNIETAISEVWNNIYPVGSIYITVSATANPNNMFTGTTWVEFAAGRTLIGMGSNGTTNYTTVEATGGQETSSHSHNVNNHYHTLDNNGYAKINLGANDNAFYADMTTNVSFSDNYYKMGSGKRLSIGSDTTTGVVRLGGRTGNPTATATTTENSTSTMQPYVVVYMWKRIL